MTTATLDKSANLNFAQSQSKAVGVGGNLVNYIRDNAPRIVGLMKVSGDIAAGATGDPFLMAYAAFAIVGRLIMIAYGTKANQKETAQKESNKNLLSDLKKDQTTLGAAKKVLQPKAYPIEASSGFSVIAETLGLGFGAQMFFDGDSATSGWTPLLLGVVAVGSYANMLFGKEKSADNDNGKTESLKFANSTSKPQGLIGGIMQKFKGNPVFTSSIINSFISVAMIVGGGAEKLTPGYITAGAIFLAANLLMAFAVSKKEFNVEGADKNEQKAQGVPEGKLNKVVEVTKSQPNQTQMRAT